MMHRHISDTCMMRVMEYLRTRPKPCAGFGQLRMRKCADIDQPQKRETMKHNIILVKRMLCPEEILKTRMSVSTGSKWLLNRDTLSREPLSPACINAVTKYLKTVLRRHIGIG